MSIEQGPEHKEHLKKVEKLHFLIHPGYVLDPNPLLNRENLQTIDSEQKHKGERLLDLYREQGRSLTDNELMFAFTHKNWRHMREPGEIDQSYFKILLDLKKTLGPRLITLGFTTARENRGEPETVFHRMKSIAEARGFTFDEKTATEAYGELINACVVSGAEQINKSGKFTYETLLDPSRSDYELQMGFTTENDFEFLKDYLLINEHVKLKNPNV